jgi:repressor of nif and glnA expression
MPDRPHWMTIKDIDILEVMAATDAVYTPKTLELTLERHGYEAAYRTINRRLSKLEERGYVEKLSRGKYVIAEDGRSLVKT